MNNKKEFQKLENLNQQHLLTFWDKLNEIEQKKLLNQIQNLDIEVFKLQQLLVKNPNSAPEIFEPFEEFKNSGNQELYSFGKEIIAGGKVGCLLIAGGQGSRLRFEGPKGMFPTSLIKRKSLFQIFSEKVVAASKQSNRSLPLAIMTSPLNDVETKTFFQNESFFGLNKDQISFFSQKMLPLLDPNGNLFLDSLFHIAEGPDGNGNALKYFVDSGIWETWYKKGIRYLLYVLVDNPLTDPFDAELVGYHIKSGSEITVKTIKRDNESEKLGLLVKHGEQVLVKEYTEMFPEEQVARRTDGSLKHQVANMSVFCFNMNFVHRVGNLNEVEIPLHKAFKTATFLNSKGEISHPTKPNAWKFEHFIFDLLPFASSVKALLSPRSECYAPLKNFEGQHSIKQVQEAIQARDRTIYTQITKLPPPEHPFELAFDFYYPTIDLMEKYKNKPLPETPYMEPELFYKPPPSQ
jgi:UDP-N-acetylglucosamine/UDP-N-acetylgalactosamine diphosphorylase